MDCDDDDPIDSLINLTRNITVTNPICEECKLEIFTPNCCSRWCNNCLDQHRLTVTCNICCISQCPWCNIIRNGYCIKCTRCIMCRGLVTMVTNGCDVCGNVICTKCYPTKCINCNTQRCDRCRDPCKAFYVQSS